MEKWSDLEKWAEETANIHIIKILRDSGYTDEQIKKELGYQSIISECSSKEKGEN